MDIGKSNDNYKDGKPKCFNCNKYGHIAKECRAEKKEQETRTCFKCDKKGHIAKDCKSKQVMKKRKVQEESDNEDKNDKEQGFWRRSRVGTVREISYVNSQNKYIIPNRRTSESKKELNMQANVKTKNGKQLKVKALVDSGCTHTGIDEQLVKNKKIQTKPINFSFEVFNADGTKNREVTKVAPLEIKINGYKETLEAAVMDLDRTDMFLGHDWLVKHNPEVNWQNRVIKFTKSPGNCKMKHKDIRFKARRNKTMKTMVTMDKKEQNNREIGKEPDKTNLEDLLEYI